MRNILITGSAGFIGRAFMRYLVPTGKYWEPPYNENRVFGIDIEHQHPGVASGYLWDARDFFRSDRAEATRHYDLVLHCAAVVGGREVIDGNPLAVATNLAIDAEMFNWAIRRQVGRIVYFSSSAAYPTALQNQRYGLSLREDFINLRDESIGRPDQTYGWAKLTGEMLAEHASRAGIPVHVFRPFSGYGTDQAASYPFRAFIDRARRHADPFFVWGDGTQVRDWIHVDDIVAAVFAAIDADVRGPVNLCTGQGTAVGDLAGLVCEMAGYAPRLEFLTDKPTGVQWRVGDPSRMLTFFEPKITLHEGIARALKERA